MAASQKTKAPPPPTDKQYLSEARGWEVDREAQQLRSTRTAWFVAFASLAVCACMGLAIAMMMPLKKTELRVVKVDNSTGIVEVVNNLNTSSSDYSEAVTKYFLVRYVRGREGYDFDLVDAAYNEIMSLSGPKQTRQYAAYILPRNPKSPVNTMGKRGEYEIKVKSVQFLKKTQAAIRYQRIYRTDGVVQNQSHWIATLDFDYVRAPATETARETNPLGFQITDYRVDPEVITNAQIPELDSTLPVSLPAS